jgi:hypothetical protein
VVCSKTNEAAELENFFPAVGFALNIFFFVFYCSAVSFFPAAAGCQLDFVLAAGRRAGKKGILPPKALPWWSKAVLRGNKFFKKK